mmetsp:Transcript_68117/g.208814  ORF Transcript_68117/g.208814 Transcript_68117/m.208814 type:complete len:218 (+) Transcript_68117:32-685(+)
MAAGGAAGVSPTERHLGERQRLLLKGHRRALFAHQCLVEKIRELGGFCRRTGAVPQRLPALPAIKAELLLHAVAPTQQDLLAKVRVLLMEVDSFLDRDGSVCSPARELGAIHLARHCVLPADRTIQREQLLFASEVAVLAGEVHDLESFLLGLLELLIHRFALPPLEVGEGQLALGSPGSPVVVLDPGLRMTALFCVLVLELLKLLELVGVVHRILV